MCVRGGGGGACYNLKLSDRGRCWGASVNDIFPSHLTKRERERERERERTVSGTVCMFILLV